MRNIFRRRKAEPPVPPGKKEIVPVPIADAVALLSGDADLSPFFRDGMIDNLQRGFVQPFQTPDGEIRYQLTDKGRAFADNFRSRLQ